MGKTMSIRMDDENRKFLNGLAKDENADLSKAVRDIVYRGRIMLAIERYKSGAASLGKAAELAGVPAGKMIALLAEYGVKSNLQKEDYLEGLASLRNVW
jgi:predicted HTH domain antitoxin